MGLTLALAGVLGTMPATLAHAATPRPDLRVTLGDVPYDVAAGAPVLLRVRVRNAGTAPAPRSQLALFLSHRTGRAAGDPRLAGWTVRRLAAHHGVTRRVALTIPIGSAPASFRLFACADADHRLAERRERNNCRGSVGFTVHAEAPAQPDPVPTEVPLPDPTEAPAESQGTPGPTSEPAPTESTTPTPAVTPAPPDATVTNPILQDGGEVGTFRLTAEWTANAAALTAAAPGVSGLASGDNRLKVCLSTHTLGAPPVSTCRDASLDFGSPDAAVTRTIPRPPPGGTTWTTGLALLGRQQPGADTAWRASSWPATGIADASIVLPDTAGATPGPAPSQGVAPAPGLGTGGVNSSLPDSLCVDSPLAGAAPASDVSTTALGNLPAYYEVGEPTGAHAGQPPKGIMIVIHGGGWTATGPGAAASMGGEAARWRDRGWRTVNTTYRACGQSPDDVLAVYDAVRTTYGDALPVCSLGASAGGHLALYMAAERDLYCAISEAGPGDLTSLKDQTAYEPADGSQQTYGGKLAYNLATAAFGQENLAAYSPQRLGIDCRVLFAIAASDPLVPPGQAKELHDALRAAHPKQYVDALVLPVGEGSWFVHGPIAPASLDVFYAHEETLVAPLG
jgi:dienelactone hydrolase